LELHRTRATSTPPRVHAAGLKNRKRSFRTARSRTPCAMTRIAAHRDVEIAILDDAASASE
jgi:hypothetical protein